MTREEALILKEELDEKLIDVLSRYNIKYRKFDSFDQAFDKEMDEESFFKSFKGVVKGIFSGKIPLNTYKNLKEVNQKMEDVIKNKELNFVDKIDDKTSTMGTCYTDGK